MRVSFRAHLLSAVITGISLVFTSIALFTCHWVRIYQGLFVYNHGIINESGGECSIWLSTPGWSTATLVFMIIAFIAQCLIILHTILSFLCRPYAAHVLKVDMTLITVATISLLVAIIIYIIGICIYANDKYWGFTLDYSFILACIALVISFLSYGPAAHAYRRIRHFGDCECQGYYY